MHASLTAGVLLGLTLFLHFLIQWLGSLRLRNVRNRIAGEIKSRADLEEVRAAIQVNLFLGVPMLCNAAILLGVLVWLSAAWMWLPCILILAVEQTAAWILFRPIEKQFKALPVVAGKGELAAEYAFYLQQWEGPHLFLKRPEPHLTMEEHNAPNVPPRLE